MEATDIVYQDRSLQVDVSLLHKELKVSSP